MKSSLREAICAGNMPAVQTYYNKGANCMKSSLREAICAGNMSAVQTYYIN